MNNFTFMLGADKARLNMRVSTVSHMANGISLKSRSGETTCLQRIGTSLSQGNLLLNDDTNDKL